MRPTRSCSAPTRSSASPAGRSPSALGRLAQRAAVEPGVVTANVLEALGELVEVLVGRSDVAPDPRDKRFAHPAWTANPIYHRLVQAYLIETKALLDVVDDVRARSRRAASGPASR